MDKKMFLVRMACGVCASTCVPPSIRVAFVTPRAHLGSAAHAYLCGRAVGQRPVPPVLLRVSP